MGETSPQVLIVEDSYMVAMEIRALVEDCGFSVVGPVATVARALEATGETPLAGAVLDINLGGERVWPMADLLEHRDVPFVLSTGYGLSDIPRRFRGYPVVSKPVDARTLRAALARIGLIDR